MQVANTNLIEERARLQREVAAARTEAVLAKTSLKETGGENASIKLQVEAPTPLQPRSADSSADSSADFPLATSH